MYTVFDSRDGHFVKSYKCLKTAKAAMRLLNKGCGIVYSYSVNQLGLTLVECGLNSLNKTVYGHYAIMKDSDYKLYRKESKNLMEN